MMPRAGWPLSPGECRILSVLLHYGAGLQQYEIAEASGLKRPTVSVLIGRLLLEGQVAPGLVPGTRIMVYKITKAGRKARADFDEAVGLEAA